MKRTLRMRVFAFVAVLALALAACGGNGDTGSEPTTGDTEATETEATATETATDGDETVEGAGQNVDGTLKLGTILPQTGDLAQFGPGMQYAVELAVQQINEAGGVLGKDVELVTGDSGTKVETASQTLDKLIGTDNVDGFVGAASSDVTKGIINKAINSEVAECSPSNTGPDFTTYEDSDPGFYFRTAPSDALQGQVLGNLILSDGHTEVGLIYLNQAYGQGLANTTTEALEAGGGSVVADVPYDPKGTDFQAEVDKLAAAEPQAVAVIGYPETGSVILQQMISAGIGPDSIAVYGADGLRSDDFPEAVSSDDPTAIDGMGGTSPDFSAQSDTFTSAFDEGAPENAQQTFAPQSYDCAIIMALAASVAQSDDPNEFMSEVVQVTKDGEKCTDFASCLELIDGGTTDIDYDGASGALSFAEPGEPASGTYDIWQFTDGDVEVLRQEKVE